MGPADRDRRAVLNLTGEIPDVATFGPLEGQAVLDSRGLALLTAPGEGAGAGDERRPDREPLAEHAGAAAGGASPRLRLRRKIAASYGVVDVLSTHKTGFRVGFAVAFVVAAGLFAEPVKHDTFPLWEVLRDYVRQRRV